MEVPKAGEELGSWRPGVDESPQPLQNQYESRVYGHVLTFLAGWKFA